MSSNRTRSWPNNWSGWMAKLPSHQIAPPLNRFWHKRLDYFSALYGEVKNKIKKSNCHKKFDLLLFNWCLIGRNLRGNNMDLLNATFTVESDQEEWSNDEDSTPISGDQSGDGSPTEPEGYVSWTLIYLLIYYYRVHIPTRPTFFPHNWRQYYRKKKRRRRQCSTVFGAGIF